MWPNILDLTQDECRGALRRLELESYSNVVGTFRAQGSLNAVKLRILKDLREIFHISENRHKAEVRRVVNDEQLSTIAKMIYGPNTEIEWNREGSRGFLIINRKPSQTAFSAVADKASKLGETLNKHLKHPCDTSRDRILSSNQDVDTSEKITTITNDLTSNQQKVKPKTEAPSVNQAVKIEPNRIDSSSSTAKRKDPLKINNINESNALKTPPISSSDSKPTSLPKIEIMQMPTPKQITANSRRRKSTTSLVNLTGPPKALLLSNRRDTMIETSLDTRKMREPHHLIEPPQLPQTKSQSNEIRVISKEIPESRDEIAINTQVYTPKPIHRKISNDTTTNVQVIEAVVPHKMDTIKGTRNVMNAISQGAQLVKVIDSKIIKKPINISNTFVTKPTQVQPFKAATINKTFAPNKITNVDYLTLSDCVRISKSTPIKTHKIQVIPSDTSTMVNNTNMVQRTLNHKNDMIPIPTARNPNIVKTSDKTIMHVSSNLPLKNQIKKPVQINVQNYPKYQQQHVVQTIQPQTKPRTVTIHPNTNIIKVGKPMSSINEMSQEYIYEDSMNHWQNYDPRRIDNRNGYVSVRNTPNNGIEYQNAPMVFSEKIIFIDDEDIITEEHITEDYVTEGVIEMEADPANYATDDMVLVSSNVISS